MLRFERAEFLWLMLLAVPMAWAAWRWMRSMTPMRRLGSVVLRLVALALIAAVLAGATLVRESRRVAVLALVDTSGSIRRFYEPAKEHDRAGEAAAPRRNGIDAVREYLRRASARESSLDGTARPVSHTGIQGRGPDDALGIIVFDGRALAVAAPTRADVLDRLTAVPMEEGTDIAAAVRLASATFPPDAAVRVVLFSDGVETNGDVFEAAREAARMAAAADTRRDPARGGSGAAIDVVPLTYRVEREAAVKAVDVPSSAPAGSRVGVRITLEATRETRGTLRLLQEGTELDLNGDAEGRGLTVDAPAGESVHVVSVPLGMSRLNRFEAVFEPSDAASDTVSENNRASAFTLSPGAGSVLIVTGGSAGVTDSSPLARVFEDAGLSVRRVGPAGLPEGLLGLQACDLVVLQNVAADEVPRESQEALAAYVNDFGGGLVMIGGPSSLGAGGWKGTPIEPLLPVRLDLPEKLLSPAAAVVIVLDSSGSMGWTVLGSSKSQMQIACEGAALAIESMDKTDLVGVITFNDQHRVVVPLGANADAERAADLVRSLGANGGTNLPPALRAAGDMLAGAKADVKHVIVLSDGISMNTDVLPGIAAELRERGINVSTIAVGDEADIATMSMMAAKGGGVYYPVSDPNLLPRVFVKAVRVVREPLVRRQPFVPVRTRGGGTLSPFLEGVPIEMPALRGLVLTQPRLDATAGTPLATPGGEPVLAHWQAGLGKVVVFTSDASEWARDWLGWPGYAAMWTNVARWAARPAEQGVSVAGGRSELRVERAGGSGSGEAGGSVEIDYAAEDADGVPIDALSVTGSVFTPSGERVPIRLSQTSAGRYAATVPARTSGNYVVTVTPRREGDEHALLPLVGGVSVQQGTEYRRLRDNRRLLERLAAETGGRVLDIRLPETAGLFDRTGVRPSRSRQSLWHILLPLALGVLLLDVASRKIAWDRWFQTEFKAALRRERAEAVAERSRSAASTAGRLRKRDREVGERLDVPPTDDTGTSTRLGTDDARKIVIEERRRRAAAESAGMRVPKQTPPIEPRPANDDAAKDEGGLFAAKRRARERMRREQNDEEGDHA